jgi:hypothetical protein
MTEAVCNKKTLYASKLDCILRKELVKYYIFGAETWTLCKVDQKYLEKFKCGAGEGW